MVISMEEVNIQRNSSSGSSAFASGRDGVSPVRLRPLTRAATIGDLPNYQSPLERRRSSFLTADSVEKQSMRSSLDDLLIPKPLGPGEPSTHQTSHVHSAPLILALLPALGGLMFENGAVVLTDLSLLILGGIFLNWCIRLPW
jgi:hypothetical protein